MPKVTPVRMLARPEKTNVEEREMEELMVRAIIRGSRVPRSPNDPESSAKGEERRVLTLWRATRRKWEMKDVIFDVDAQVGLMNAPLTVSLD